MGLLVTADIDILSDAAPLCPAGDEAIAQASFPLSRGNVRLFMREIFLDPDQPFQEVDRVVCGCTDLIGYHEGKLNLSENTLWAVEVARKFLDLSAVARAHGACHILAI